MEGKINPSKPDEIVGTKTWTEKSEGLTAKTTYTIKYKLTRKPIPLIITDVKFYQPNYPWPNSWEEIDGNRNEYAIDGNQVKIVASILNVSDGEKTASVNFKELKENENLPDSGQTVTLKPKEEKEVELVWDTNGYAWKKNAPYNYAINTREIEVSIPDDKTSEQIFVYPKPVVIVPGMWSKREKTNQLEGYFKNQNVPWTVTTARVYVGKKSAENVPILDKTVRDLQKQINAWHVDLVAHSTGGLTARAYINSEMPIQF